MPKNNLRKQQLLQEFLESKGEIEKPTSPLINKEELSGEKCYWDYSPPKFSGDMRLSCQHRSRSGELQHRELIILFPTGILEQLGREGKLKGKALEDYVRQTAEEGNSLA